MLYVEAVCLTCCTIVHATGYFLLNSIWETSTEVRESRFLSSWSIIMIPKGRKCTRRMQASLINGKKGRRGFCVLHYGVQPVQFCYYVLHSVLKLLCIHAYAFIRTGTTDKPLVCALVCSWKSVCKWRNIWIKKYIPIRNNGIDRG